MKREKANVGHWFGKLGNGVKWLNYVAQTALESCSMCMRCSCMYRSYLYEVRLMMCSKLSSEIYFTFIMLINS